VLEKDKGLHLQIVCKIYISSLVTLNKLHEMPQDVELNNVTRIFYEHKNHDSKLKEKRKITTCSRGGGKEAIIFTQ